MGFLAESEAIADRDMRGTSSRKRGEAGRRKDRKISDGCKAPYFQKKKESSRGGESSSGKKKMNVHLQLTKGVPRKYVHSPYTQVGSGGESEGSESKCK